MDFTALIFAALKSAKTANERLDNLPDFMKPCGTIGADGDLPDLPSDPNVGDVYFVATDGTYDGHAARIGDMFYFNCCHYFVKLTSPYIPIFISPLFFTATFTA